METTSKRLQAQVRTEETKKQKNKQNKNQPIKRGIEDPTQQNIIKPTLKKEQEPPS